MKTRLIHLMFGTIVCFAAVPVSRGWSELPAGNNAVVETDPEHKTTNLVFRNAEIRDVLQLIAQEFDLNIVMSDEVRGSVSVRLKDASLANTLDAILISRGYDYDIRDNVIRVGPADIIEAERQRQASRQELEPLVSEVIILNYLDANDIKSVVQSMLSSRGSVAVVEQRPYRGFQFGSQTAQSGSSYSGGSQTGGAMASNESTIRSRSGTDEKARTNTLMVVDIAGQLEKIKAMIAKVDVAPRQVLIDAKILEVDTNTLEDLGLDLTQTANFNNGKTLKGNTLVSDLNSGNSASTIASTASGVFSNTLPTSTDSGYHAVFTKMRGEDTTLILHALLQDQKTKTLSAPKILTVENQEAAILVGEQYPIFQASVSDQGTTTESLSYYQPIGISLQVVAQVTPRREISMIIHPAVSSVGNTVTGTSGLQQPRINIREADTRVLIKNGETLVIGGLLEDVEDKRYWGLPYLDRLPVIGGIFSRRQTDINQRNLLIFITPRIVDADAPLTEEEKLGLQSINSPKRYGFLYQRRFSLFELYREAKRQYRAKNYDAAREGFLEVISLDPHHAGAARYLKKMKTLPDKKW